MKQRAIQTAAELIEFAHQHGSAHELVTVSRGLVLRAMEKAGLDDLKGKVWVCITGAPSAPRIIGASGKPPQQKRWELVRYSEFGFMSAVTEGKESSDTP